MPSLLGNRFFCSRRFSFNLLCHTQLCNISNASLSCAAAWIVFCFVIPCSPSIVLAHPSASSPHLEPCTSGAPIAITTHTLSTDGAASENTPPDPAVSSTAERRPPRRFFTATSTVWQTGGNSERCRRPVRVSGNSANSCTAAATREEQRKHASAVPRVGNDASPPGLVDCWFSGRAAMFEA